MTEAKTKSVNMTFPALLSKHERNFRTGAEFWRDRNACDRLEYDVWQTESDIHYCGFDVYRDQSALTCVQDI